MTIEIPLLSEEEDFTTPLSHLFDAIADLVFEWGTEHNVDTLVSAITKDADSKMSPKTDGPPQNTLACEADPKSNRETLGELIDRVGEKEAMNYLLAQSIQLRLAMYDLLGAIADHGYGGTTPFWGAVEKAEDILNKDTI